jgi:hypothetical protein
VGACCCGGGLREGGGYARGGAIKADGDEEGRGGVGEN